MSALVLLQGGNPVPNWAVAAFLHTYREDWLLMAERLVVLTTVEQRSAARRLVRGLRGSVQWGGAWRAERRLVRDANDGAALAETMGRAIEPDAPIHLSYTGGTKVMAVHAPLGRLSATCSYLDAATHRLWVEGHGFVPEPGRLGQRAPAQVPPHSTATRVGHDLRLYVQLPVQRLLQLHGTSITPLALRHGDTRADDAELPAATRLMADLLDAGHLTRPNGDWERWRREHHPCLRQAAGHGWTPILTPWPLSIRGIPQAIATDFGLDDAAQRRFVDQGNWGALPWGGPLGQLERHAAWRFLAGGWLERAVVLWTRQWLDARLVEARRLLGVQITDGSGDVVEPEVVRNLVVYPGVDDTNDAQVRMSEIDVLAMVGHQLLAISCTVDHNRAYDKAVEVWFRAKQLGGDEARAVIVSLAAPRHVNGLAAQLQNDYGGVARVTVVGQEDLQWLGGQAGRERFWARLDEAVGWN